MNVTALRSGYYVSGLPGGPVPLTIQLTEREILLANRLGGVVVNLNRWDA